MRKHPSHGRAVIENAERAAGVRDDLTLAIAKDIVYTHHEWWNGTGYPQGLKGAQIPIPGRIMAVVDVYDAIRTRNLYKAPMSQDEAVKYILDGKGTHFDPAVVEAFVQVSPMLHHLSQLARRTLITTRRERNRIRPVQAGRRPGDLGGGAGVDARAAAMDAVVPPWLLNRRVAIVAGRAGARFSPTHDIRVRDHD
jgi:HD-GYP domain-containing protein (c-di-GMP phosphodiesterase class II)